MLASASSRPRHTFILSIVVFSFFALVIPFTATTLAHPTMVEETQLFSSQSHLVRPALAWNASEFKQVDDSVRGGSSSSSVTLDSDEASLGEGELVFQGYLDTTTLGGAGFASQQYVGQPVFPVNLSRQEYKGLQIRVRAGGVDVGKQAESDKGEEKRGEKEQQPGGGKGPVTSYVLNLYTTMPQKRPDGRTESSVTYEHTFNVSSNATAADGLLDYDLLWDEFKPMYRGRPADDAGPLKPDQVKMWSVMARSDFGSQSGNFRLQISSLYALPAVGTSKASLYSVKRRDSVPLSASEKNQQDYHWSQALEPASLNHGVGFSIYLLSILSATLWLIWTLTPDEKLKAVGIVWYPNRSWALVVPAFFTVAVLYGYVGYLALNLYDTPALHDIRTLTDSHAQHASLLPASSFDSFDEAKQYYLTGHPFRLDMEGGKSKRDDMWDLPRFGPRGDGEHGI